jgi:hypothetical protein
VSVTHTDAIRSLPMESRRGLRSAFVLLSCGSTIVLAACGQAHHASARRGGSPILGITQEHVTGLGSVKPSTVALGGDGTSVVYQMHWATWGSPQAEGTGTAEWVWPGTCNGCNSSSPARVVAFDLGTCNGRRSYKEFEWYFPQYGERFRPNRAVNACNIAEYRLSSPPTPSAKCPPIAISNGIAATDITTTEGLSCPVADRVIVDIPSGPYKHERRFYSSNYRCGTGGTFGGPGSPSIICQKGEVSVTFNRVSQ